MKPRMKSIPASIVGYVALIVILTAGAAQSLTGTNTVDSGDIIDGTIATPDLKTGSVSGSKILDNSIAGVDIAANAVGSSELAAGAVIAGKVGPDAVGENQIGPDEIGSSELDSNAVDAAEIAADAVGSSEIATGAVGGSEVNDRTLTLNDFATAEDDTLVTTTSINANTCVTIATGLSGAAVGDLPIVVLRSATSGTFWEGLRVTTAGQFPLRACNTTDANLASATSTIDVFTVRP